MATRGRDLDVQGRALLLEDLQSPCTEEVAVFHAFSRVVSEARRSFVVVVRHLQDTRYYSSTQPMRITARWCSNTKARRVLRTSRRR